jgi:DNA-binding NtrC family response regulator
MMTRVLLVNSNRIHAEKTARVIGQIKPDWQCLVADSCNDGRKIFSSYKPDVAVLHAWLQDGDALGLLKDFKAAKPDVPVIMVVPDDSESWLSKVRDSAAYSLLPAKIPVGMLVMDLEMALEASRPKYRDGAGATQLSYSHWKKPHALATFSSRRAIALYKPFDIFSLVRSGKDA